MKTITKYVCEICEKCFLEQKDAEACEKKGKKEPFHVGMIFANHLPNHLSQNYTYAIASSVQVKHSLYSRMWFCNDKDHHHFKTEGTPITYFEHPYNKNHHININHVSFKIMVDFLNAWRIPITLWDGEKAVPFVDDGQVSIMCCV